MALMRRLRERGVRVRILTNSLASTDMPIVHVGYMRYRDAAARGGLRALRGPARAGQARDRATGSSNPGAPDNSGSMPRCSSSTANAHSSAR